ncbi:MAG TPA: sugar phosphate nucleotidyltransferase [Thermoanaerobaculia bacterium]|nr:sugar phosphate nucleotidyltransferase [Thermoanaerobaculia bacterium]
MRALLLAGGVGTRLWPLSNEERPKQFLPLLSEKSLLAETFERLLPLTEEIFVATAERHADLVLEELKALPADRILMEPARRNSGPALLSAAIAFERDGDPVTAAIPSDQTVADPDALRRSLATAGRAADSASAVVLAVPPSRPDTDFGYLEVGEDTPGEGLPVVRFLEKPGQEEAEACVKAGCFWNAGIFVFRPSRFLAEARRVAAPLVEKVELYRRKLRERDEEGARRAWEDLPSVSIDYAVMEKANRVRAVPLRAGWSDVGTWRSVRELRGPTDEHGNLIFSKSRVVAPGVRDSAIVVSDAGILIMPFERENELRSAVERAHQKASETKTG